MPPSLCLRKCDFASELYHPNGAHTPAATKNYRSSGLMFFLSRVLLPPLTHLEQTYNFCYIIFLVYLDSPNKKLFVVLFNQII